MIFKASLDKTSKRITVAIAVLFALNLCFFLPALQRSAHFVLIGTSLLLVAIFVGAYLFRTTAYEVTPQQLIIHRPLKNKILDKTDIIKVELFEEGALSGSTRLLGNGGLFGYYGQFSNRRFGYMTWYATNRSNPVLLQMTGNKKII